MKKNHTISLLTLSLALAGCATDPIDPLDPTKGDTLTRQTQCPIGYKPVQSTSIVIKSTDKDKKAGQTTQEVKCEPER